MAVKEGVPLVPDGLGTLLLLFAPPGLPPQMHTHLDDALLLVVNMNEGTHASPQLHILHDNNLGWSFDCTKTLFTGIYIYTSWYTVETIQTTLVQDIILLLYDMAIPIIVHKSLGAFDDIPHYTH